MFKKTKQNKIPGLLLQGKGLIYVQIAVGGSEWAQIVRFEKHHYIFEVLLFYKEEYLF